MPRTRSKRRDLYKTSIHDTPERAFYANVDFRLADVLVDDIIKPCFPDSNSVRSCHGIFKNRSSLSTMTTCVRLVTESCRSEDALVACQSLYRKPYNGTPDSNPGSDRLWTEGRKESIDCACLVNLCQEAWSKKYSICAIGNAILRGNHCDGPQPPDLRSWERTAAL